MTRKKKQPPQQKRQQVTDPSGWTYITKGPKNNMTSIAQLSSQRLQTSLTIEDYAKKFNSEYRPQWQESACLQSLTQVLEQHVLPARNVALTKCICLGLGSLLVGNPTSSYELAALISMLDILSKHSTTFFPDSNNSEHQNTNGDPRLQARDPRSHLPRSRLQRSRPRLPRKLRLHRPLRPRSLLQDR